MSVISGDSFILAGSFSGSTTLLPSKTWSAFHFACPFLIFRLTHWAGLWLGKRGRPRPRERNLQQSWYCPSGRLESWRCRLRGFWSARDPIFCICRIFLRLCLLRYKQTDIGKTMEENALALVCSATWTLVQISSWDRRLTRPFHQLTICYRILRVWYWLSVVVSTQQRKVACYVLLFNAID